MRQDKRAKQITITSETSKTSSADHKEEWLKTLAHLIVDRIIEDRKNGIVRVVTNKHQVNV